MSFICCKKSENRRETISENEMIDEQFLTEEDQSKLTPDLVLDILKKRNNDFANDNLTIRNTSQRIRKASLGQYPKAVVLSCLDSRVPVEDVFHSGIGDLFVARVAGNISNEDILGSLEFACKVSGAKVVIVLGHEHCGAVKSAIDHVELGNITALLSKIRPAIEKVNGFKGEKTSGNNEYLEAVTKANINQTIFNIRNSSLILKEMEAKGEIKIVGGEYHMETGNVEFLSN
ncbi:carbonic anhydrase [Chryseobacterium sp. JV558]|nr:carbonic anhydrase [Chryseobacterium sp. JV558]